MSKPDPLALAREFVATVEKFDSVPFMMTSYDAGKLAICRALIEASEHLNRIRLLVPVWMGDVTYDAVKRELDRLGTELAKVERATEQLRREARARLAEKFADEVATWPADKLRRCLAQPEAVAAAEDREAKVQTVPISKYIATILSMAPPAPAYWEVRLFVRSHRWHPTVEVWHCCADHDDGTCDEEPSLAISDCSKTIERALHNVIAKAKFQRPGATHS